MPFDVFSEFEMNPINVLRDEFW